MTTSRYTFAELEFLLGDAPQWPQVRSTLGLQYEGSEAIRAAGAASLIARELAEVDGKDIVVSPEAAVRAHRLVSGGAFASLILVVGRQVSTSTYLAVREPVARSLVSLVAPGVFDIKVFATDQPAAEQLADLAVGVLDEQAGVLSVGSGEVIYQLQREGDQWSSITDKDSEPTPISRNQARDALVELFGPKLDG